MKWLVIKVVRTKYFERYGAFLWGYAGKSSEEIA